MRNARAAMLEVKFLDSSKRRRPATEYQCAETSHLFSPVWSLRLINRSLSRLFRGRGSILAKKFQDSDDHLFFLTGICSWKIFTRREDNRSNKFLAHHFARMDVISFRFPFYKCASQSRYRILQEFYRKKFFKVITNAAIITGINRCSIIALRYIYRCIIWDMND